MSKWKTMDSAPRDGTEIIVCDDIGVAEYCVFLGGKWRVAWNHDVFTNAKYWRPVPKLPKEFRK